jgi:hypothetical protein
MATELTYNGIDFDDIRTTDFTQKPILTDDRAGYLYDEIHIKITALFNNDLAPSNGTDTPESIYNRVKACLTSKGKNLLFVSDGVTILNITAPDAKGGPFPGSLSVRRITTATWEIEYDITAYVCQCCNTSFTPNGLLANRWMDSVSIDQNQYTTWARKGKLYFRYDSLALGNTNPDNFRYVVMASCPLKPGFIRTKLSFAVSSDWLNIDYDIEDKEIYAMPLRLGNGGYITDWTGTYKASSKAGAILEEELTIELTGDKLALKSELYQKAAFMANAILGIQQFSTGKPTRMLLGANFEHDLHTNKVSLSLRAKGSPRRTTLGGYSVPVAQVSRKGPWTGNDNDIPDPGSRGTARLLALANIIGDPCIAGANVNGPTNGVTQLVPGKLQDVT